MKNREKYAEQILDIACNGDRLAIRKSDKRLVPCSEIGCTDCIFGFYTCEEAIREWAESEYIEPVRISKRDKVFLDYLGDYVWQEIATENYMHIHLHR